jgi:hypothetical protein
MNEATITSAFPGTATETNLGLKEVVPASTGTQVTLPTDVATSEANARLSPGPAVVQEVPGAVKQVETTHIVEPVHTAAAAEPVAVLRETQAVPVVEAVPVTHSVAAIAPAGVQAGEAQAAVNRAGTIPAVEVPSGTVIHDK